MQSQSKRLVPAWWLTAVAALVVCIAAGSSMAVRAQGKTSKDGVYSAEQSKRGEVLYAAKCAVCHGKAMEGGGGPSLAGAEFLDFWDKMPVSEIFTKIFQGMPADAPQSLTRDQSADLVAYILQMNKNPAGQAALPTDDAALKVIAVAK